MSSPIIRLAEVTTIILCTCFPMMPRLVKLISARRAKSKSYTTYTTSPLGHAWKQISAIARKNDITSGAGGTDSEAAEETTSIKRPDERWGEVENTTSGSSRETSRTEDIKLATV